MKYIAFDLEIAEEFPEEGDPDLAELGITCAATYVHPDPRVDEPAVWHGANYAPRMSPDECWNMFEYIRSRHEQGYTLVTWNGLGFDLPVLMYAMLTGGTTKDHFRCREVRRLARSHVDMMFAFFCAKGYTLALNTAAEGLQIEGKTEGMSGKLAPAMWKEGQESQEKVLEYVAQDARVTGDVYEAVMGLKYLPWISKAGRLNKWFLDAKNIPTVRQALRMPKPNTSWMDNPWPRSKFAGWLEG